MTSDPDEQRLIEQAREGEVAAFEALYRLHVGKVYGLCLRIAGNRAEAEDSTQETFIKAWRQLASFRGESRLTTWLHRIAVNEVLGRKRRAAREAGHLAVVDTEPARHAADPAGLRDLEKAISQLPERAREVFVLTKVYGYTHEETGSMLGVAAGTSKAQLHRALKLLESILPSPSDEVASGAANGHAP